MGVTLEHDRGRSAEQSETNFPEEAENPWSTPTERTHNSDSRTAAWASRAVWSCPLRLR